MGECIWGHVEGLHSQGVVFQAFSTIRFSSPCHWLSNAPPLGGGQLEWVGSHHGFWVWPSFEFAPPLQKGATQMPCTKCPPGSHGAAPRGQWPHSCGRAPDGPSTNAGQPCSHWKAPQSGQFPPQKYLEYFCTMGHRNCWPTSGNHCLPLGL